MSEIHAPEGTRLTRDRIEQIFTSSCREVSTGPDCLGKDGYDEVEVRYKSTGYGDTWIQIRHITVLWNAFEDNPEYETIVRNEVKLSMYENQLEMLIAALQDAVAQSSETPEQWRETTRKMLGEGRRL